LFEQGNLVGRYRDIMFKFQENEYRDILFKIITDELVIGTLLNYIYTTVLPTTLIATQESRSRKK